MNSSKLGLVRRVVVLCATACLACGGAKATPENVPTAERHADGDASVTAAPVTESDASVAPVATAPEADAGVKSDRPFAESSLEATHLIDEAVEQRRGDMEKCVVEARERRKTPHAEVTIELGIDQEGALIGVKTPKGTPKDKVLLDCIRQALATAPFPRSKSGVITLKKRFTEEPVKRK